MKHFNRIPILPRGLMTVLNILQVDELDRKLKNAHEQVFDLKERLAHVQAESKMKATQYEGKPFFFSCVSGGD